MWLGIKETRGNPRLQGLKFRWGQTHQNETSLPAAGRGLPVILASVGANRFYSGNHGTVGCTDYICSQLLAGILAKKFPTTKEEIKILEKQTSPELISDLMPHLLIFPVCSLALQEQAYTVDLSPPLLLIPPAPQAVSCWPWRHCRTSHHC